MASSTAQSSISLVFAILITCLLPDATKGLSEEMQELADQLHNTCRDEVGVAEETILNARKGGFPNDDEHFKCYLKCLMEQMACIDEKGIIDEDATIAVLPDEFKELAEPIVRKCGTKIGKNPCDNAFLTHKCYYESDPEHYFLI